MGPHLLTMPAAGGALVDLDGTFFIQLGIFLVMFIFLYAALFRPVVRLIEARREATEGAREKALAMKEEAASMVADADSQIADVRTSAMAERDRAVDQARRLERDTLAEARDRCRKITEDARAEMTRNGEQVRAELEGQVDALAAAAASRILGRTV